MRYTRDTRQNDATERSPQPTRDPRLTASTCVGADPREMQFDDEVDRPAKRPNLATLITLLPERQPPARCRNTVVRLQPWKLSSVAGLLTPAAQAQVTPTGLCHVERGAAPAAWHAGLDRCATGPVYDHLVPRRRR
jgi:hypothetical protein